MMSVDKFEFGCEHVAELIAQITALADCATGFVALASISGPDDPRNDVLAFMDAIAYATSYYIGQYVNTHADAGYTIPFVSAEQLLKEAW